MFAWDLDFARSVQPGDEFRVLYERTYLRDDDGSEAYYGPGRILAARYAGAGGSHSAVYYETAPGRGAYYRPDGSSVERRFLAAPLNYSRVSSSFQHARLHPILKIRRPHYGIDYAAPSGTPVWSVAHGRVIYRGWANGYGRLVKIRHAEGYVSYYAHLSRYTAGLDVGDTVRQKQVIGYVGSSGLATGPHVCFRVQNAKGRFVNPAALSWPSGDPIPAAQRTAVEAVRDQRLAELGPAALVATDEAL
jgi:murein DD-endopeptidase MepM/ murein hydrolase activator NlpD